MKLAVVGASGFIGAAIVQHANGRGNQVRAVVRRQGHRFDPRVEVFETGDLLAASIPGDAFEGCDAVINCVARVHVMRETEADPDAAFKAANSDLALRLLDAAAQSGVSRFVQLSSVAAVTSRTPSGTLVTDDFKADPQSPYGRSKLDADQRLQRRGNERGISLVALRPPTVFGPGVKAYFGTLLRCAKLGVPLPVGAVRNSRSFMFLCNLADAVTTAAARTEEGAYIVTDSAPVSTAQLYRGLLRLCRRPVVVPRIPLPVLRRLASFILGDRADSLLGDAAYDGSRFARDFAWAPPVDFETGLRRTVGCA